MDNPKVSVIVPIYKVEAYLEICVESLRNQMLTELEIILVDDGSPDRCGEIADEYAKKDTRIQVVHQSNSGLGPARNTGIQLARGEYIGFVDSDDWVKPEMYQNLYREAVLTNADIVVSGHCDFSKGIILEIKPHPLAGTVLTKQEEILALRKRLYGIGVEDHSSEAFPMSTCMSLYRTDMIRQRGLRFENILSEDTIFNLSAYRCAKVISFIQDVCYCYRKENQASITYTFSDAKCENYKKFLTTLNQKASLEEDWDCKIRAKRTAIDSCRMYIGLVGNARISLREKRKHIYAFAQDAEINKCWKDYPSEYLPIQQRLFHWLVVHGWYTSALFLNWLRQRMKKGKKKGHGIA